MKIKYLFTLLMATILVAGCDQRSARHHYRPLMAEKEEVKIYKVRRTNNVPTTVTQKTNTTVNVVVNQPATDNTWLYWYIIYDTTTRSYYSASSSDLTSTFSSLTWSASKSAPTIAEAEEEVESVETVEVETPDLGEASTEISSDYSSIPEDNSLDSMEGVPESSPSESSTSAESSSDAGGGDAGGGDGGGGGD